MEKFSLTNTNKLAPNVKNKIQVPFDVQNFIMELLQRQSKRSDYFKTCCDCIHFNINTEGCALANGVRPPAYIIVNACPKFEDNIPF